MPGRRPLTVVTCDGSPGSVRVVDEALAKAMRGSGPAVLPVPAAQPDQLAALAWVEPTADERTALVVATSGSTGEPKLVELSAAALRASAQATHERLGGLGSWLLALPVQHIAGLQVLVRAALAGITPAVVDMRSGFRPGHFTTAAKALRGRRYTALVPTQLGRLLDAGGAAVTELRGFDAVLLGGAATPGSLLDRAHQAEIKVITTYGMTETAGGCVYDGYPLAGVQVRLDQEHRVELTGPMLAHGYHRRPELTATAFADGWFRTDDLGRLHPGGRLEVLGRTDDVIITGGRKVSATLVEQALAGTPGVARACVVGLPDPEWGTAVAAAVVATDPAVPPDHDALRASVREQAGPAAVPKFIAIVPRLPALELGKIDRKALRRQLTERRRNSYRAAPR